MLNLNVDELNQEQLKVLAKYGADWVRQLEFEYYTIQRKQSIMSVKEREMTVEMFELVVEQLSKEPEVGDIKENLN